MVGRKSLALVATTIWFSGCATTASIEVEPEAIVSSSVRIERKSRGPAIAHVERQCEVGEVQRVIELLAASGTGRVNLKVENGASADVITKLPATKDSWLVVAVTDAGFTLYMSDTEQLGARGATKAPESQDVPLRDGEPDWERLTNLVRALAAKNNPYGTSVIAPATGRADLAIEALQQIRFALPEPQQRRYLLAL